MILFWFLVGILGIYLIARYNQSNKLFWILLFSYVGMFTAGTIFAKANSAESRNKTIHTQVCPTQAKMMTSSEASFVTDDFSSSTIVKVLTSVPVSKDYTLALCVDGFVSSKIYGKIRGQPLFSYFDTS